MAGTAGVRFPRSVLQLRCKMKDEITFKAKIRTTTDVSKKDQVCNVCFSQIFAGDKYNYASFKRRGIKYGGPVCLKCAFGPVAPVYRLVNRFGF